MVMIRHWQGAKGRAFRRDHWPETSGPLRAHYLLRHVWRNSVCQPHWGKQIKRDELLPPVWVTYMDKVSVAAEITDNTRQASCSMLAPCSMLALHCWAI